MHGLLLILLLVVLVCSHVWPAFQARANARWLELILASATAGAALTRRLPLQNVISMAILILLLAGIGQILILGATNSGGLPLKSVHFSVAWVLLWVLVVWNSRGLARLGLWPVRLLGAIGFLNIALATVVAVAEVHLWGTAFNLGTQRPELRFPWNVGVETALALVLNVAITPALIDKRPVPQQVDFQPLLLWAVVTLAVVLG